MPRKPTVALDFDGVLAKYTGWRGAHHTGVPTEGALPFIQTNRSVYQFVVHTVRDPDIIEAWLHKNGFPPIPVTNQKPKAFAYIDDRAIRFNGNWESVQSELSNQPWWKV